MTAISPKIQMVDLKNQYLRLKADIDREVMEVLASTAYINGPKVKQFQAHLEQYLDAKHVIPCANGTDALQIALMALGLQAGDEVIVPAFTYVATAEVIALLQLKPVMVDVDPDTFNLTADIVEQAITPNTKAVVPVHLFGQSCDMEPIMAVARKHGLYVVEDNAQAIGADYTYRDGRKQKTGTIGDIGCTSFYPSKNLGAYGDGGAISTNNDEFGTKCRSIANHGQARRRYYHDVVGVNSRLDALQAAILGVKLKHLDDFARARQEAAAFYDNSFKNIAGLKIPKRQFNSTHVFHQYTLIVEHGRRDALKAHLEEKEVPSMIYYPVPLYKQEAYKEVSLDGRSELPVTEMLCNSVLSLPIHTELNDKTLEYIGGAVGSFFG